MPPATPSQPTQQASTPAQPPTPASPAPISLRRAIHEVGELRPDHACFAHGRGYDGPRREPKVLWASDAKPRKDHDAPGWLTATEFEDHPNVA